MTTTHTPDTTRRGYAIRLRRELAVLPRRSRLGLLQDLSEHAVDTTDEQEMTETVGDPTMIARAALDQHDAAARRPLRPSALMPSKLLQLAVAILASPFAVIALIDLFADGSTFGLPRITLWAFIAVPPLLARWTTWWRTSLGCTILYACYLTIALTVSLGGWNMPSAGVVLFINGPLAVTQAFALALSVIALLRAPKVLRTR